MDTCERFGVMLDCSRNAVMKVSEVKRFIDILSKMGYNCLELYTEDTYEIKGEPYFGYLRGRYTGEELKEIDAYAKEKGVELIPCVQTLAHFTALVRNRVYHDIVDVNDILLIDEPKTYEFIDKIFATLAENFTSRLVNIGMDEAHMVGLGKYLDKHGYQDRHELLLRHLNKVAEIAKKYGFKAHMWDDMFFRLAHNGAYYVKEISPIPVEIAEKIPENVEPIYWDYYNNDVSVYDVQYESRKTIRQDIWFAGGAWTWHGFAPWNKYALQRMKPAMQAVRKHGVKNVLITMWGDNGKECSSYSGLPALYAIRQYADGNFDEESIAQGFYKTFGIPFDTYLLLDSPNTIGGRPWEDAKGEIIGEVCKTLLYCDPFMGIFDDVVERIGVPSYANRAQKLAQVAKETGEFSYVFDTLSKLCSVLEFKATLGVETRKAYQAKDKETLTVLLKKYDELPARIEKFHEAFCSLWHKENKPFGWEIQDARLGGVIRRIKTCRMRLQAYLNGEVQKIEELEEKILPVIGREVDTYVFNNYASTISRSIY